MATNSALLQRWPRAVCVAAITLAVALELRFEWKVDDAYIAFSYAQNMVHGNGLVFNVGERVEGYTCFLWVLLSALGLWLGFDIVVWSTALGLLIAAGTVFAAWRLTRALAPQHVRKPAAAACILVAAFPPFAWWAASGMETALFTLLVTLSMWCHVERRAASISAPILLGLASMTRPEGWLLSALLCLDAIRAGAWPLARRYCALFCTIFVPYYCWRFLYYGYPLPNTFYAKVGASADQVHRGVEYMWLFLSTATGVILVAGAVLAAVSTLRRAAFIYIFLLAYGSYTVVVGGDVFPLYRFFIPVLPLLAALSVAGVLHLCDRLFPRAPTAAHLACGVLVLMFSACCVPLYRVQKHDLGLARLLNNLGQFACPFVKERVSPGESVAAVGIGQLKYCSDRRVIDIVGLTDTHIAHHAVPRMGSGRAGHERYDSQYVLAQRPKYIFIPLRDSRLAKYMIEPVTDLWNNPAFDRDYVAERSPSLLTWYRRRDAPPLMSAAETPRAHVGH